MASQWKVRYPFNKLKLIGWAKPEIRTLFHRTTVEILALIMKLIGWAKSEIRTLFHRTTVEILALIMKDRKLQSKLHNASCELPEEEEGACGGMQGHDAV